jgi:hypothetical protein
MIVCNMGCKSCGELATARNTAEMAAVAEEPRPAPFANLNCREQLRAVPSPLPFLIQVMARDGIASAATRVAGYLSPTNASEACIESLTSFRHSAALS